MFWVYALLTCFVAGTGLWSFYDFANGANFLAEAMGAFATVAGVERLIDLAERRRVAPIHRMARRDLQHILRQCSQIVTGVLQCVVTTEDLPIGSLAEKRAALLDRFDARRPAPILFVDQAGMLERPKWSGYLESEVRKIDADINRFVERYVAFISPKILESVHSLQSATLMVQLRNIPGLMGMSRNGSFPGVIENFASRAERLRNNAKNMASEKNEAEFPDFGNGLVGQIESIINQAPFEQEHYEYRPPRT